MALERNNPLPPNARYWVDVAPADQAAFSAWLTINRAAVKVVSSSRDPASGWEWVLFETTAPLVWWEGPGYPTKADPTVARESDVKQIPHVETSGELLDKFASQAASQAAAAASSGTTKLLIGAVAVLGAALIISRIVR